MSSVFNVKEFHGGLPGIQEHMHLEPLAAETNERQEGMWKLWSEEKGLFHTRLTSTPEQIEAWKVAKLRELVDWAYTTSPFYHALYSKHGYELGGIRSLADFEKLPTLTKDDVIAGFPVGLPSREFDIHKCRWMSSSGSSGKQVQIVLPQQRADLDILFKYRMFEWQGGFRLDPKRWLYNIHYVLWWHTSMLGRLPVFSVTQECPPEQVYEHLKLLKPQVVSSIGSYLNGLAELGRPLDELGVKVVSTNSETTTPGERKAWEEIFRVPVRDEYSSEELDILAVQCNAGHYHVLEDDVHVEVVEADRNGLGEIVGTDLWNKAMPMIRYRQGDLATVSQFGEGPCQCGSQFRRLAQLHGRADQAFITKAGVRIIPSRLLDAVEAHLCSERAQIREFRVIQTEPDQVELLYVPKSGKPHERETVLRGFQSQLEKLFGHAVTMNVKPHEVIPEQGSFKRRTVICQIGARS